MARYRHRLISLVGIFAAVLAVGCDLTPTEIDALGEADLEKMVAQAVPPGPGRELWQQFIDRFDAPPIESPSLPGLDSLFSLSSADVNASNGGPSARDEHRKLLSDAWRAIERGETDSGEAALTAARAYQAETVVQSLGAGTPLVLISLVGRNLARLDGSDELQAASAREPRLRTMSLTARDLLTDARQAMARGEAALALDLATHAAGLVNAMQGLLRNR